MSRLLEIYNGWKNLAFPNPQIEELAKKRMAICVENSCGKLRPNNTCAACGCFMPAKVRSSKSKCLLKKW